MSCFRPKASYLAGLLAVVVFFGVWLSLADSARSESQVTVTGSNVNIRSGPGTGYGKVELANTGDVFSALGIKDGWYQIRLSNQGTGWVLGTYVKAVAVSGSGSSPTSTVQKTLVVNVDGLNVRNGPGTNYGKIAVLNKGQQLTAVKQSGDWYYVNLGSGKYGWVAAWLVTVKTTAPVVSQSPSRSGTGSTVIPVVNKVAVIIGTLVNVRVLPGTDYGAIGQVSQGDRLPVAESSGDWLKVRLPDGSIGWIAKWLASLQDQSAVGESPLNTEPTNPVPDQSNETPDTDQGTNQPQPVPAPPYQISGVEVTTRENGNEVLVVKSGGEIRYRIFTLKNPDRLVVDIEESTVAAPNDLAPGGPLVQTVRTSQFSASPMVVRVVLDLSKSAAYLPILSEDRQTLTVSLSEPSLKGKVIVIDPGHGGYDPGAIGVTGLREKEFNLLTSLLVRDKLVQMGAQAILTRENDTFISLTDRAVVANNLPADVFLSIHANFSERSQARGTSTYYYAPSTDSVLAAQAGQRARLAQAVQRSLISNLGTSDMGVLQANFSVLRNTQIPSILVESAFLSNSEDEALLKSAEFREKEAQAIVNGLLEYFAAQQ